MATQADTDYPSITAAEEADFPHSKSFRRVASEIAAGSDDLVEESFSDDSSTEETIHCECCGMSEECTPEYINSVKAIFCGKWVCGICSEAAKEQQRKNPSAPFRAALESHMALCVKFRRTVRLNPKLSLASSMREIARKSSQRRNSNARFGVKMGRNASCGARFDLRIGSSPVQ
ncbi:uncharacterized protein LOC144703157 isoform X2 [Wolffia australiana]